ncbi:NADH:flavin oxidoreductase [Halorussus gelatinilyticus]|uniref:NADH:flavin oxidoreductase n=1 Tax=Halorussus gelatinilyticus TaxID=2937524 RepID=A0A8U0IJ66_9EURY|nr:NADH:flavin oxidoreductase [Halorussus gelatinilyticus]UPW00711.1 NADH:flavin oxidoreductase [Halorussus gelatinilyticus]
MENEYDVLFDAFDLDGVHLDNRVGLAPMTRTSATADGRATEQMKRYYVKFARGGFSFLVTEGTYPDEAYSQGYDDQPGLANESHVEAWREVTDAVHDEGAPIFAQLMHAGALSQGNRYVEESVGPSAVEPKGEQLELYGGSGEFAAPKEMTKAEMDEAREGFVEAARRADEAGFDGVEIHGANGYLLDQFLTEYTNERDDEYGGSVENRVRYHTEVVEAVQDAVPEEFVVGVRISQSKVNDPDYRWSGGEDDAEVVFGALDEAGADFLHVTEEDITTPAFDSGPTLAELADEYATVPVIANGGLGDPEAATRAVESHGADLVAQATSALANPDWPNRVAEGRAPDEFDFGEILQPDATIGDAEVPAESE